MSVAVVKKVARLHLNTLIPVLSTAWENVPFTPPDTIYQRVQFFVHPPEDPTISDMYYRERVQMQIFINGPAGVGTGDVDTRAELVRSHFNKGLTIVDSATNMRIYVLRTPQIAGSQVIKDRVIVPVLINLVGEVYK